MPMQRAGIVIAPVLRVVGRLAIAVGAWVGAPRGVIDSDKDGNAFVVGLVLTAKSLKALNAAEAPHLAMLKAY